MTMTGTDWLVVIGGSAAIAWVNWYFFLAQRVSASALPTDMASGAGSTLAVPAEIGITVRGGYSPSTIRVKAGRPVRLVFDRQDTSSCSEEVVLPDFGIRRFLPSGTKTTIKVTPPQAGRYEFMCGMSMLRGTLIAED